MITKTHNAKTIFVTSFHSLVSRVLESGVLDHILKSGDVRVVIFVPHFKKTYFEKIFGRKKNIIIEGIERDALSKQAYFFYRLAFMLLDTKTMYLTRRSFRGYRHKHEIFIAQGAANMFGRSKLLRNMFRMINYYFSGKQIFTPYFEKYKPDLVFSTDIKEILDTQLLIEAKKQGIRTVGMVRSWDYLTGKGMTRVNPDKMIVHNETIKNEAIKLADMNEDDIFISGLPHFDPYINAARAEKKDFFNRVGIDQKKRILFYAPWGSKFLDTDWQFLATLNKAIENGKLPPDVHILIRLPPGDGVVFEKLKNATHITIDIPGVAFDKQNRKANEMSFDDLLHLANSLFYSSVVVTPPSTIVIDACALDKPVVLMAYDGDEEKSYYEGVKHYYDFSHVGTDTFFSFSYWINPSHFQYL